MILVLDIIVKNKSLHGLGFFFFFFNEHMALVLVTFLKLKTTWIYTNLRTLNLSSNAKLQDGKMLDNHLDKYTVVINGHVTSFKHSTFYKSTLGLACDHIRWIGNQSMVVVCA